MARCKYRHRGQWAEGDVVWMYEVDEPTGHVFSLMDEVPIRYVIIFITDEWAVIRPDLATWPHERNFKPRVVSLRYIKGTYEEAIEGWAWRLIANAMLKESTAQDYYKLVANMAKTHSSLLPTFEKWVTEGKLPDLR